jgi:hypothetical protein
MAALGIVVLILAHAMDYATFVVMVLRHGLGSEMNPIVAMLAADFGMELLTAAKVASVLLVAATFLVLTRSRPFLARAVLVVGILVGGLGAYSNIITL